MPCSTSPDALTEGQTLLLPSGRLSARDKEILEGIGPWTYRTYPVRAGETLNVSCCSHFLCPLWMLLARATAGSACRAAARHMNMQDCSRISAHVSSARQLTLACNRVSGTGLHACTHHMDVALFLAGHHLEAQDHTRGDGCTEPRC